MKNIIILLLFLSSSLFGLISITPVDIGDNPGFHTKAEVSLNTSRGSADIDNYSTSVKLTYDNNRTFVMWGEFSYVYGEVNSVENTNNSYLHLRYIQKIEGPWCGEFFLQRQEDKFKLIKYRGLGGSGIRYKFPFQAKSFIGLGGFYENTTYTSNDPDEHNFRVNSYFSYKYNEENFTLSYIFYYQPKIDDFKDYVETNSFELLLPLKGSLSLKIQATYNIDSKPPIGVNRDDFSQTTSFILDF